MAKGWGEVTNSIGFGTIYQNSWFGFYTELNSYGYINGYLSRVKNVGGIIENKANLIEKVKRLFSI